MFNGVIFDFNGTLFWDNDIHNRAWDVYLKQFNMSLSDEEKHLKVHGKNNTQIMTDIFGQGLRPEEIEKRSDDKELIYQEMVKEVQLQLADGAIDFFEFLKKNNIPFNIVTASHKLNVDFFIEYLDLERWFETSKIVFGDGTLMGKPAPDMFLKGMELLNMKVAKSVIFEDSETGLEAAYAAKPGKVFIVNSTSRNYSKWDYQIIRSFHEVDRTMFS